MSDSCSKSATKTVALLRESRDTNDVEKVANVNLLNLFSVALSTGVNATHLHQELAIT